MEYETHQAGEANGLGAAWSYPIFDELHQSACYPSVIDNTVSLEHLPDGKGPPIYWEPWGNLVKGGMN